MHLFYVDESGQRDYNNKNSRHFVLGAVAISDTDWREWNQKINAIKMDCFGTQQIEWKSVVLRQPDKCERVYLKPYGITRERLIEAVEQMYVLINEAPITIFAAVIDKRQMVSKYAHPVSSTSLAYEFLIERIASFLSRPGVQGHGMMVHDLIQESPGQAKSHQKEIADLHERIQIRGKTDYTNVEKIIEGVHFLPTDQSNFLQVADMTTYNVYRQFADYWKDWDENVDFQAMPKYQFFERIVPKFFTAPTGSLKGYGIKKSP